MADALELPANELRDVTRLLHGDGAHSGEHLALLLEARHVTDREHLGMTGETAVALHDHAALAIGGNAELLREAIGLHTRRPHHGAGFDALARSSRAETGQVVGLFAGLERDAGVVDADHANAGANLGAELLELLDRALRERRRERRQDARTGFDEDHLRLARVDGAEVTSEDEVRQLGDRARELDAGGAAADHREREELAPRAHVGLALGAFEGEEHAAADLERVLEVLQSGRMDLPVVVTEVRGLRADREHEPVVREGLVRFVSDVNGPRLEIDARDVTEHDAHVGIAGEDAADGRCDLGGGEARHRHLIEERLEEVVVGAVDQRDLDVAPGERLRGLEAAEAAAHDHHAPLRLGAHRKYPPRSWGRDPAASMPPLCRRTTEAEHDPRATSFPFRHVQIAVA
ncbi:MAG: hypothetical protein JWO86_5525 [Myxococcaceae bacterium]|nr:hypothetical protein [Myxococcaceae bacterium]